MKRYRTESALVLRPFDGGTICHINENAEKEIANMDHSDFSTLLQEIEHH